MFSDPLASPSGFPFKVVVLCGSVSEKEDYETRKRICDLGYLRRTYKRPDGALGYRCASEDVNAFVRKGGKIEDSVSRKCICNGLLSAIGLPQARPGGITEKAIVTAGDGLKYIARFVREGETSYTAGDVIRVILSDSPFPGDTENK